MENGPITITQYEMSNLLYLKDENNSNFCWIKDISKLVSKRINDHNVKNYVFKGCSRHFYSEAKFKV